MNIQDIFQKSSANQQLQKRGSLTSPIHLCDPAKAVAGFSTDPV